MADIPGVRITADTNKERAMTINLQNRNFFKFKGCECGIYFYYTEKKDDKVEEKITSISIPLLIIIVFRPSRKIKLMNQRINSQSMQGKEISIHIMLAIHNKLYQHSEK